MVRSTTVIIGVLNQPPRLRQLRRLATIFFMAQPPLLSQGGEIPRPTGLLVGQLCPSAGC